jgi:hypothetical protein
MSASVNENGVETLFLDGHNNPGFSGGPIVYRDLDRSEFVYKVAGVVSGFRFDSTSVLKPEEIKPEQVKSEDITQARIIQRDGRLFQTARYRGSGKVQHWDCNRLQNRARP